jgi:hypothetical protein
VGIAIDALTLLLEDKGKNGAGIAQLQDIEAFRGFISDFMKS